MKNPKPLDYILLTVLALIWSSAFFNIKIATYSYGPVMIAFLRIFFGAIPVIGLCLYKKIKIEAFSKDWYWFAAIGLINLVIPFFLIAYGVQKIQSNLAAILMATTPLSATILAHLFTDSEKINFTKVLGVLVGFSGIVFLFSDSILINDTNFMSAILILIGSTFYVIGGLLTLKVSNKANENVTSSILIWATIFILPISLILSYFNTTESLMFIQDLHFSHRLDSTISLIYLGTVPTGIAWLIRFRILKNNGLVFQAQVAYLIPIFGVILGYIFLKELITPKVLVALIAVILGIYFVKKSTKKKITLV
jgi:drug/metabolite transporter (DMT)-like permease|tara:strand:+ start:2349 stop:3275 length:927 start_codon:yes stop_codon:yes gene_type:complete